MRPVGLTSVTFRQLTADQSNDTAGKAGKKGIPQILSCNSSPAVSQCLQSTNLGSVFLHHSGHRGKADQRCYKKEDHRKYFPDCFDSLGILFILYIRLNGISA